MREDRASILFEVMAVALELRQASVLGLIQTLVFQGSPMRTV